MKAPCYLLDLPQFDPLQDVPLDGMHVTKGIADRMKGLMNGSLKLKVPKLTLPRSAERLPPPQREAERKRRRQIQRSFQMENKTLNEFRISRDDKRLVNERWANAVAPSSVYVKSRHPFKLSKSNSDEKTDAYDTLKGSKCIDALLFCEWAPILLKDIIIKDIPTSKLIIKLLRATSVLLEDGMADLVKPHLLRLLSQFDAKLPQSMRQSVFHSLIHIIHESKHWNSARNTWCFGMESAYGILSRYVKSRRHPASNLLISQGQTLLSNAMYNEDVAACLDSNGMAEVKEALVAKPANRSYLCGDLTPLLQRDRWVIKNLVPSRDIPVGGRILSVSSASSASCHGRTMVAKNLALDQKKPKRVIQSYCILRGSDGKTVHFTNASRTRLVICVGRILGLYAVTMEGAAGFTEDIEYAKLTAYKAYRPASNVLKPYRINERTAQTRLVRLQRLHLQPALFTVPGSESFAVYGVH